MLKEINNLLIPIVIILSTASVTANTSNELEKFTRTDLENNLLSQQTISDENWLHFDDGTTVNSIGLSLGGTFQAAIRITPDELAEYNGYELSTVRWYHGSNNAHAGCIIIYDTETSSRPGELITSEEFVVDHEGWFEIPLSNPVLINISKDIWVSVKVTHMPSEYPLGVGPGPVVYGKGGWISQDGVTWLQLGIDIPDLNYNWNIWAKVETPPQPPETPQQPAGPEKGVDGVEYTFLTSTTDPDGEQICYKWDWDDGTPIEWTDYYNTGATVYSNHTWSEAGLYSIRVKAKDSTGLESNWSAPKKINILFNRPNLEISNITGGLFKIITSIKNTGAIDGTKVNWSIIFIGGIILPSRTLKGTLSILPAGEEKTISSGFIFGFGRTTIRVTVECTESSDFLDRDAFVFFFFTSLS